MSRTEELLTAMLNGETVDIVPRTRAEQYLKNCVDACGCDGLPAPRCRLETLLYQLANTTAGGNTATINIIPRSRVERYLKNCVEACGCNDLPAPRSRVETLLYQLAEKIAEAKAWIAPVQTGSDLYIEMAYSVTQSGTELIIE